MSHEASKAAMRRMYDGLAPLYMRGDALDIGAGMDGIGRQHWLWPGLGDVREWDLKDGDAQLLDGIAAESFDLVHSSHCLEHMVDARAALVRWFEVVKPGGYLVTLVPDEDMYEQGHWPPVFNPDHKWTFTPWKPASWSPVSLNVIDLVVSLGPAVNLLKIERLVRTWMPSKVMFDRTATAIGESAIEFVVRKRSAA